MEKLYDLLSHLLENEYDLNAVIYILEELNDGYDEVEQKELKYQTNVIRKYLVGVSKGIRESIDQLDELLATGKF